LLRSINEAGLDACGQREGPTRRCGPDASSGFIDVLVGLHFNCWLGCTTRRVAQVVGVCLKRPAHLVTAPGSVWWSLNQ